MPEQQDKSGWKRHLKFSRTSLIIYLLIIAILVGGWFRMIHMPGRSYTGPLPPLSAEEQGISVALRAHVEALATEIGERNCDKYENLLKAEEYITGEFRRLGLKVERQEYQARAQWENKSRTCANLIAEIPGAAKDGEAILVGAHYDSVVGTPGANDNASGVAAVLCLAKLFSGRNLAKALRFVAFVNEEPPNFQTDSMGSLVYARRCRERGERIAAMFSLETIGYYSDEEGSQPYPKPLGYFYPTTGNFIAFVGNVGSAPLVKKSVGAFRRTTKFPCEGAAVPDLVPGVGWSDHWAFWQVGYPGVMVSDTATFRYGEHYHMPSDTPDKIDYERLARVTVGLGRVLDELLAE